MLNVDDLSKEFGGLVAVDNVEFEIGDNEIVGLIGPNGAGKTTLFNTITGIYEPEKGSVIEFNGQDLIERETHDIAQLGIVRTFQIVRVFEEMTVLENVTASVIFGSEESVSRSEAEEIARENLEFIGLANQADAKASSLPIAKKKQLELARALASEPELIMLDEIASGLTPGEIEELTDIIQLIRDEHGVSVFWIEHIMDAIMGVADRIIVLHSGQKIAEGTPEEIRSDETVVEAYLGDEA